MGKNSTNSESKTNIPVQSTIKTGSTFISPQIGNKQGTSGFDSNQAGDVGGIDIGQLQQLLQLLNEIIT
mgnify:FL=1